MKSNHQLQIFKDTAELSNHAANAFIEIASHAIAQRGRFLVALSGGNTPMRLYDLLGNQFQNKVDWKQVHFFWGDERCVPVDDAGNSYGQAKNIFLDKVNAINIHRIKSDLKPADAAIDFANTLKVFSEPPLEWPRFDLVLLGMGDDGHTASLFPGSPVEVDSPTLAVTANYQDRPANRVTLTQNVFNDAHNIFFLVTGKSKAETLLNVLNGEYKPELYPAQRINPHDGKVIWFVDEAAASQIKN
ncbi:MAG: 6-phosphogluconolactonase [Anaerolineales bacterium]|nr:6-phosphogluconolactonase [Anaerolineales bacterium]